ncbi:hypothetical protein D3C81_1771560 [compost metagenome]
MVGVPGIDAPRRQAEMIDDHGHTASPDGRYDRRQVIDAALNFNLPSPQRQPLEQSGPGWAAVIRQRLTNEIQTDTNHTRFGQFVQQGFADVDIHHRHPTQTLRITAQRVEHEVIVGAQKARLNQHAV